MSHILMGLAVLILVALALAYRLPRSWQRWILGKPGTR
jgi:hypothetical protein